MHGVVGRGKAIQILIPWRRAWENQLNGDTRDVHEPKCSCKDWHSSWRSKEEHDDSPNDWSSIMKNSIWQPCKEIEECVLVRGEDVAQIGSVKYVFESWEDFDPNVRSVFSWDESIGKVSSAVFVV